MAVAFKATSGPVDAGGAANLVLTLSAVAQGDLLVVMAAVGGGSCTPPAGWVLLDKNTANGTAVSGYTFYWVATPSPPTSFTFVGTAANFNRGCVTSYTGAMAVGIAHPTNGTAGTSPSWTSPAAMAVAGSMVLGMFYGDGNNPVTGPGGYAVRSGNLAIGFFDIASPSGGTVGSITANNGSNGTWVASTIVLPPTPVAQGRRGYQGRITGRRGRGVLTY